MLVLNYAQLRVGGDELNKIKWLVGHSRRGTADQEPGLEGCQVRPGAECGEPPGPHRNAD